MALDALLDEQGLTGEVAVGGAGLDARVDELDPALAIRPDGRRHHPRGSRQLARLVGVGDDYGKVEPQPLQLLSRAPGDPDLDPGRRGLDQVFGDEPADEPGGPEDDDVK